MIRLAAAILVAAGFALGGRALASRDNKKVETIKDVLRMINIMETRLRFSGVPVAELLLAIENGGCNSLIFISKCRAAVENGEPFNKAWRESIIGCRQFCRMLPDESAKLVSMGSDIGVTDIDGQLSCYGYYREIFSASLSEKDEKRRHSAVMFPPLGILLGISAALFLI